MKIPCLYMHASACMWPLIENTKSNVKHFENLPGKKYRISIGLRKQVFFNIPIACLNWNNETKLVPANFRTFIKKAFKALKSLQKDLQRLKCSSTRNKILALSLGAMMQHFHAYAIQHCCHCMRLENLTMESYVFLCAIQQKPFEKSCMQLQKK